MPKVSIVIPIYNVEKYLKQCLNSILNQTYTNWECLLVDDGSTDLSWMICDNYSRKDDRFKVIHQKNQGVSKARNVGIEAAKGEFLVFIDPDDYIDDDYLYALIVEQKQSGADIVLAHTYTFLDDQRYKGQPEIAKLIAGCIAGRILFNSNIPLLNSKEQIAEKFTRLSGFCWAKLFKFETWGKIRFPENISWGEDTFTTYEALCNAKSISETDDAVYWYRMLRKGNLSHKRMPLKDRHLIKEAWIESCDRMMKSNPYVQENLSRVYDAGIRCLQIHAINPHEEEIQNPVMKERNNNDDQETAAGTADTGAIQSEN